MSGGTRPRPDSCARYERMSAAGFLESRSTILGSAVAVASCEGGLNDELGGASETARASMRLGSSMTTVRNWM